MCKPGYQRSRRTLSQLLVTESSPRGFSTSQRSRPASPSVTNSVLYFVMTRAGARAHIAIDAASSDISGSAARFVNFVLSVPDLPHLTITGDGPGPDVRSYEVAIARECARPSSVPGGPEASERTTLPGP